MVERICPQCQAGNPVQAQHCAVCGTVLHPEDTQPLAKRPGSALMRSIPAVPARWQQASKAAALAAVALAVEVGAAWLQQRSAAKPAPLARRTLPAAASARRPGFVARQRVWETYEAGRLSHRVIEQTVWRLPGDE